MLVVTRHAGLVEHLLGLGLITAETPIIPHATPKQVAGQHVIGVLPLSLAALAASVTEVPLNLPPELRGVELSAAQVALYAGEPVTYIVRRAAGADEVWDCGSEKNPKTA